MLENSAGNGCHIMGARHAAAERRRVAHFPRLGPCAQDVPRCKQKFLVIRALTTIAWSFDVLPRARIIAVRLSRFRPHGWLVGGAGEMLRSCSPEFSHRPVAHVCKLDHRNNTAVQQSFAFVAHVSCHNSRCGVAHVRHLTLLHVQFNRGFSTRTMVRVRI